MSSADPVRAVLVVNPNSGSGECVAKAATLQQELGELAIDVDIAMLGDPLDADDPSPVLIGGGDGTVRALLDDLARTKRPAWHLPWGTANLFAKSLDTAAGGLSRLAVAIRTGKTAPIDIGRVAGQAFACCASTGPDAETLVRRDDDNRHLLSYLMAFASAISTPRLPEVSITCDGQPWIERQRGVVLIANSSRHIGVAVPVPEASMHDGRLDLAFVPAGSGGKLLHWLGELVLTGRLSEEHVPRARIVQARVESHDEALVLQADGELVLSPDEGRRAFEIAVERGAIRALLPMDADPPA